MNFNFYRGSFTTLIMDLPSNEALGLLDTGYLEDYNGVDGQLTLHHVDTTTDYSLTVTAVPAETPSVDNDYFRGSFTLAGKPNGVYQIRGRCRDTVGNVTILNSIASPAGGEDVRTLTLTILAGTEDFHYIQPGAGVYGGYVTTARLRSSDRVVAAIRSQNSATAAIRSELRAITT